MLRSLSDDGLFQHAIKAHSLDKITRHDFYASVFSTAMKKKWPQRAYIGLYSGPGRARIEATGEIVETTAMGAVRVPDPFTHYIFVDDDERSTKALENRIGNAATGADVTVLTGDANEMVPDIKKALPDFSRRRGLISFCFVDPYAANVRFQTLRDLAEYKIDFLILLMLGRDARTNLKRYLEDENETRIADLVDCPTWRQEFRSSGESIVRFLLRKFDQAMTGLGYLACQDDLVHQVKIAGKNVFLYSLVLYSRSELGQQFWRETLTRTNPQFGLEL
ncbi:MAG: three-Cys-motif partner protein TcmP [Longimicrobiales bacterium]